MLSKEKTDIINSESVFILEKRHKYGIIYICNDGKVVDWLIEEEKV